MAKQSVYRLLNLEGRVAVVVGGTGQIGTEICDALAELGANVVVASRSRKSCNQKAEILTREHQRCLGVKVDATDRESIEQMVEVIIEEFGRIDVLVNAAYSDERSGFQELTEEEFHSAFRGGLLPIFLLVQEMYPYLQESDGASVLTVGSTYGIVSPDPHVYDDIEDMNPCHYGAIKAGIIQLTKWLAVYCAPSGIRLNCVSPGAYFNEELEDVPGYKEEYVPKYRDRTPLGRLGREGDLKGVVALLASDAGRWMTGQNIVVDGGWTIW